MGKPTILQHGATLSDWRDPCLLTMWRIRRKQSELRRKALQKLDVLLVDSADASADLTLLAIRRSAPSAKVVRFRNASKALSFVSLAESGPNLILLDCGTSPESTLEMLQRLRSNPRTGEIPVIVLAAASHLSAAASSESFGANEVVAKADVPEEFCDQVNDIIQRWLKARDA